MKKLISQQRTLRDLIENSIFDIDNINVFNPKTSPTEFHIRLNQTFYNNQFLPSIMDLPLKHDTSIGIIIPLRHKIVSGMHLITSQSTITRFKVSFKVEIEENKEIIAIPDSPPIISPFVFQERERESDLKKFDEKSYISKKFSLLIALIALSACTFYGVITFATIFSHMVIYDILTPTFIQTIAILVGIGITFSYIKSGFIVGGVDPQDTSYKRVGEYLILLYVLFSGYYLLTFPSDVVEFLLTLPLLLLSIVIIIFWLKYKVNLESLEKNRQSEGPKLKVLLFGLIIVPLVFFHLTNYGVTTFIIVILAGIGCYLIKKRKILKIQIRNARILLILIIIMIPFPILLDRFYTRNNIVYTETYNIHPQVFGQIILIAESFDHITPLSWNYNGSKDYELISTAYKPSEYYEYKQKISEFNGVLFIPDLYFYDYFTYNLTAIPITKNITIEYVNNNEFIHFNTEVKLNGSHFSDIELSELQLNYLYLNSSLLNVPSNVTESVLFSNGTLVRISMEHRWTSGFFFWGVRRWSQEHIFIFDENDHLIVVLILGPYMPRGYI